MAFLEGHESSAAHLRATSALSLPQVHGFWRCCNSDFMKSSFRELDRLSDNLLCVTKGVQLVRL